MPGIDEIGRLSETLAVSHITEEHFHNVERWWGSNGAPSETAAIASTVTVPFVAASGAATWGSQISVCGTNDIPLRTGFGYRYFDAHRVLVVDTDHNTPYRLRFVWGTGTFAAAVSAQDWTEIMFITEVGPFLSGVACPIMMPRITTGYKVWAQLWNGTLGATASFYWGSHGYVD